MSSIFLSHSTKDKAFARRLARDLKAHALRVWVDDAEMVVGDSLIRKLDEAIREMEYLGVLLSPDSIRSEWVQREVEIALNQEIKGKKIKVLPILYRDCDIPGFLTGRVWADFREESSYEPALTALLRRLLVADDDVAPIGVPTDPADGFRVLNWNIGGDKFLELAGDTRLKFKRELNSELTELLQRYHPDVVTLQEVTRCRTDTAEIEDLIEPIHGYSYYPVPLIDSTLIPARSKWAKVRQAGHWPAGTYFTKGNALLVRTDAPLFGVWDLPAIGSTPVSLAERSVAIEHVHLESGLYFGDRNTEPRAAHVAHFVFASAKPRDIGTSGSRPLDVFVVNVQLGTVVGERQGLPNLDVEAASRRKAQLEIIVHGIVSRYNNWRHAGYPFRGQRRSPEEHESFDRCTPIWVLAGAFNFTETSEEYEFVKRMNFVDTVLDKGAGTKASDAGRIVLDYVFAGPMFVAMDPRIIHAQALRMNIVDHSTKVSDHFPIIATIPMGSWS
ncbi:MAG: hypothetical protein A2Y79_04830 [Deltaproteobacteria bacterium RBG_13_43_22]|nr:MAG: hypothetical protein A2Y79_04830 [Deltaproteobacteria bacterium RBG_13_43_22]